MRVVVPCGLHGCSAAKMFGAFERAISSFLVHAADCATGRAICVPARIPAIVTARKHTNAVATPSRKSQINRIACWR